MDRRAAAHSQNIHSGLKFFSNSSIVIRLSPLSSYFFIMMPISLFGSPSERTHDQIPCESAENQCTRAENLMIHGASR